MDVSENKYWFLRNHQLFRTLANSEVKDLCIISRFIMAKKSEFIYLANDNIPRIYLLKIGMIRIVEMENGKETIKDIIKQGDLFGELSLSKSGNKTEMAQVMSKDVSICSFRLEDFENVLAKNSQIALTYTKMVGEKMKNISNRYSGLVFKDVRARLIAFLKNWAATEGVKDGNIIRIKNYLTHSDIAGIICSTRQTVTELINDLEYQKKLTYTRSEVVLKDL